MPNRRAHAAAVSLVGLVAGLVVGLVLVFVAGHAEGATAPPTPSAAPIRAPVPVARLNARHRPSRLAEGGFNLQILETSEGTAEPAPWRGLEPTAFLLDRLSRSAHGWQRPGPGPGSGLGPGPGPRPVPRAVGDRLVLSLDDGIDLPVLRTWEGRLDVSGAVAGASDAVAVRFPSQSLAKSPPFRVTSVIVGLDDLHGATTWPSVEAWLEDGSSALSPRRGSASAMASLDALAAGLSPAPAGSSRPTDLQRLSVPLSLDVPDAWLSDGAFDDAFARPDGMLDDGLSDWLECQDAECASLPASPLLRIQAQGAVRSNSGYQTLAVKFADASIEAQRRPADIDQRVSVVIRETNVNFGRAGLALRAVAADTYYRVEYVKATTSVQVAVVFRGAVTVLNTFPVGPSTGSRALEVVATGGSAAVDLAVTLDGTLLGTVQDTTYRLVGGLVGLSASDITSLGEEWDDFVIERRPDIFAVIGFPPGENVALPIDLSLDSMRSDSILVSTDGSTFNKRPLGSGCAQPGNPFVQLEVEDSVAGDRLFDREVHVVEVAVSCATCPPTVNTCSQSRSLVEASPSSLLAGQELVVAVGWWNEHASDDSLIFTTSVFDSPCDFLALPIQTGSSLVGPEPGQLAGAGALLRRSEVAYFTPTTPGEYCVVVLEQHDANGDCCPDGAESTPLGGCGGACVLTLPSDSNVSTAYTYRDVRVLPPCTPRTEDVGRDGPNDFNGDTIPDEVNLDGASLRVSKSGAGPDSVALDWSVVDIRVFPARYNVLLMEAGALPPGDCFRVVGPVFDQPSGSSSRVLDMPISPGVSGGGCLWFAIYETDGCGGDASVADSNSDDSALVCP